MKLFRGDALAPLGNAATRRSLALAAAGALLLSACHEYRGLDHLRIDNVTAVELSDPELRHPIQFAKRRESLDVEVPAGAEGLSPNQHVDVYRFLQRYRREAVGRLVISAPAHVRDRAAMAHSLQGVQQHVAEAGIDYRVLRGPPHDPRSGVPHIRLAYERPTAIPPACGQWTEDVGRNEARIPYPNWGCATQRNTAVMVDNARDLRQPQAEDPRIGERRSAAWSGYIGGGAAKSEGDGAGEPAKKTAPASKK
jgi:pilus assembly protein CpaD